MKRCEDVIDEHTAWLQEEELTLIHYHGQAEKTNYRQALYEQLQQHRRIMKHWFDLIKIEPTWEEKLCGHIKEGFLNGIRYCLGGIVQITKCCRESVDGGGAGAGKAVDDTRQGTTIPKGKLFGGEARGK